MAGRFDVARDLLVALHALEGGALDRAQLIAAVRAWTRSDEETLAEFLARRPGLAPDVLARLENQAERELDLTEDGPEPALTVTYPGQASTEDAAAEERTSRLRSSSATDGSRFRILRPHARGGLGEVFLAFDGELNRSVALKELQPRRAHDPDAQARFLNEAEVTGKLEHPGIVPVYSLGRYPDGRPYYAMRLIEGETLARAIERFHRASPSAQQAGDRELAFRRLLRSLIDTCNAVAYAHSRGVVHRDLKPENIMLGRFGETLVVDWGVAKSLSESGMEAPGADAPAASPTDASMTQPGSVLGTPCYMSPEQAAGDLERIGPASDIYSLGAMLYSVLVGQPPFTDGDVPTILTRVRRGIFPAPRRVRRSVDPRLETICLKAMALDPGDRHASALALATELEAWQADLRYRVEQELAVSQLKGALSRLYLERAHGSFLREAHDEGMLWLARALEHAPDDPPDLPRAIRTSLSGWFSGSKLMERSFRLRGKVLAATFCPEGRKLATACEDGTAQLWDGATGSPLSSPLKHDGPVRTVAFQPDGKLIASAGDDGTIRFWDAVTGEPVGAPLRNRAPISALRFSADGSRIAAMGGAGGHLLWNTATGRAIAVSLDRDSPIVAVVFSPDGASVAVASEDGAVRLIDAATGKPIGEPLMHESVVSALAFDAAGRRLLIGFIDGKATQWEVSERAAISMLSHHGEVHCVEFRPGGDAFATACENGTARLWDATTGAPIGEPLMHPARIDRLAFRPDGTILATGSPDGTVRLWCAGTGLPIGPPLSQAGSERILAFTPDGRRFATGGPDATLRCWKVPELVDGTPERIVCWISVTTELEFDTGDAIRRMDGPTSWDLRRRLSDLGGPPLR